MDDNSLLESTIPPGTVTRETTPGDGLNTISGGANKALNLLDLPLDILREIVKEITLTHDLTSLALTCSALHSLAIPAMYSRFDIVWPEPAPVSDQPVGVDALSYGLATLVMGANAFKELPAISSRRFPQQRCQHCGCDGSHHQPNNTGISSLRTGFGQFRIGNSYAQWTKKFCVGNGPSDWVQEYAITKETGKLLGTLVALAVARMINLESFIWDMPTGVMRDVFLALASLDARSENRECRLERVWIRWHDNFHKNRFQHYHSFPATIPRRGDPMQLYKHVEYPTFSVLPPLKSLSVLSIDEPAYLEEMAILIERSRNKLTELRIGMAFSCHLDEWAYPTEIAPPINVSPRRFTPGWPKPGGVLSILRDGSTSSYASPTAASNEGTLDGSKNRFHVSSSQSVVAPTDPSGDVEGTTNMLGSLAVNDVSEDHESQPTTPDVNETSSIKATNVAHTLRRSPSDERMDQQNKLSLEILELEKVVIYTPLLMKAIDWSRLTTLTILHCEEHESLWRALRRKYTPSTGHHLQESDDSINEQYAFKLKHLHTDRVSPYLMLFMKEAIAPNTVESIYFQEGNSYTSVVSIEAIYKHVLRRQRASLKKVLIDRSRRSESPSGIHGHWRDWMLSREALAFVTSGKMTQLRELGIGMDRRDWHFFLQRLPRLANLRALYLPNMFDLTLGRNKHRELALQILDIVTLRPEIQLCYIGIEHKCFEILEAPAHGKKGNDELYRDSPWFSDSDSEEAQGHHTHGQNSESQSEDEDDDGDDDDDDDDEDDNDDDGLNTHSLSGDDDDTDEENEGNNGSNGPHYTFRLREILFYDDKISIFKSRHCSL